MKKYLMLLSGISAIGVGAIAGTINTNNSNVVSAKAEAISNYLLSQDEVKYDITMNSSQTVALENLLSVFKDLNKIHTEQNKEVVLTGLPPFVLLNDEGTLVGETYMDSITWVNINGLINSDVVDFKDVSMIITDNQITVLLNYKIDDADDQLLELFTYNGTNIPSSQDHMRAVAAVFYETN